MIRPEGWMLPIKKNWVFVDELRKKYGVTDRYTEGHTMKAGEAILIPAKDLEVLITTSLIDELESLKKEVWETEFGPLEEEYEFTELIDQRIAELKK